MELKQVQRVLSRGKGHQELIAILVQDISKEDNTSMEQRLGLIGRVLEDVSRYLPSRLLDISRSIFVILHPEEER